MNFNHFNQFLSQPFSNMNKKPVWEKKCSLPNSNICFRSRDIRVYKNIKYANCFFVHLKIIYSYTCDYFKTWKQEFSRVLSYGLKRDNQPNLSNCRLFNPYRDCSHCGCDDQQQNQQAQEQRGLLKPCSRKELGWAACSCKKHIDLSFSCVCPVIDNEHEMSS